MDARQVAVVLLLLGAALVVERLERKEIAVVGYGECAHPQLAGAFHERNYLALSVKQGVRRVQVQVYEISHSVYFFLWPNILPKEPPAGQ